MVGRRVRTGADPIVGRGGESFQPHPDEHGSLLQAYRSQTRCSQCRIPAPERSTHASAITAVESSFSRSNRARCGGVRKR